MPLKFQKIYSKNIRHAYHLFLIVIDKEKTHLKRDKLATFLLKNKIGVGINYRSITDMHIYKKKFHWNKNTAKQSKYLGDNILSLPLYPDLTLGEVNYICHKIKSFFN